MGFVELPDEALEILSHFTQSPAWSAAVITSRNQDSYAVRMARVLGVPVESEATRELLENCDLVIVGGEEALHLETFQEMLSGTEAEVIGMTEAAERLDIPLADEVTSDDRPEDEVEDATDFCLEMERPDLGEASFEAAEPEVDIGTIAAPETPASEPLPGMGSEGEIAPGLTWDQIDSENEALGKELQKVLEETGAESGSIMLLDRDGEHLGIAVSLGLSRETIKKSKPKTGSGLAGKVFVSGKPRGQKAEVPTLAEIGGVPRSRIAASVPIFQEGRVLGALSVNVETEEDLSETQVIDKLSSFLPSVQDALFQAIKFSAMSWEMKQNMLFQQVDRIMSLNQSFPERLEVLGEVLRKVLQADSVHLYLFDPLSKRLELVTEPQGMAASRYQPVDHGVFGWAARSGETRIFLAEDTDPSRQRALACLNISTLQPYGLLILENLIIPKADEQRLRDFLEGIVEQLVEIYELEQGVTTQDILSGLRMRIADQASRLDILPPELRIQPSLELAIQLLAAEVSFWIPGPGQNPVIAQPRTQRAAKILAETWERFEEIGDWIRENGSGQYAGVGSATEAPEGPAPYIGVKSTNSEAVLLLMYDPEEDAGPFSQLPFPLLTEVLYTICDVIERDGVLEPPVKKDEETSSPDGIRLLTLPELNRRVQEEQMRSSRTGLPFSLTRVEYLQGEVSKEDHGSLTQFLLRNKRKTDFLGEIQKAVYVVLSPDTDPDTDGLGYRLRECWREQGSKIELAIDRCYLPDFKVESRTTHTPLDRSTRAA